jgi:hypothetical protein
MRKKKNINTSKKQQKASPKSNSSALQALEDLDQKMKTFRLQTPFLVCVEYSDKNTSIFLTD